ncbi:hypothetical protein [Paenibacillus contaminans]|uniref:hypothetical protein n=1 Tax=Paenibacillus contaminans TaxID=450362 RepID=UPI0013147FCB|nr:hypothetical protein [Paenibacillus contaminans]
MLNLIDRIFGGNHSKEPIKIVRKVKHSEKPALTNAKHGTVILRGKIEEEYKAAK